MNEQAIFLAAMDIVDQAERQAFLRKVCAGSEVMQQRVDSLLAAHEQPGEFLDVPVLEQIGPMSQQSPAGTKAFDVYAEIVAEPEYRALDETQAEPCEGAMDETALALLEPSTRPGALGRLAHYEVLEVLGQGAFGTVVKAFDDKLQRMVAIKILSPQLAATSPARKRFLREARSSAAVRHENVVDIHAIEERPLPFLVMEYIGGETLQQRLNRVGPLEVADVLRIGVQIAHGLAAAHAMGKVHRDIKPANILLENGVDRVKISDFGLARAADDASLTQSGVIAGTPMYMSPEQAQDGAVDHRADLFSFGSVLYVMCSGRPPFRASTTLAVLKRVAEDTPRPIRQIIPEVPTWLCDIIDKLHAKNPNERFASAKEVADILARYLAEWQLHGKVQAAVAVSSANGTLDVAPVPTPSVPAPQVTAPSVHGVQASSVGRPARSPALRGWLFTVAALLVLVPLGWWLASVILRLETENGTLIVEINDDEVEARIKGGKLILTGPDGKVRYTVMPSERNRKLAAGPYKIAVEGADGLVLDTPEFLLKKGAVVTVRVTLEPKVLAKKAPSPDNPDRKVGDPDLKPGDPDRKAAEYVVSIGGRVRVNDQPLDLKPDDPLPREPFRLTSVNLHVNEHLTEAGLAHFKDCKHLKHLNLYGPQVTDAGLTHFKGRNNLLELTLQNAPVTEAGLALFKDCKQLILLELSGTKTTDAGLAFFKDCKKLTTLKLDATQVTEAGLSHFKDCKSLLAISLNATSVSDEGLAFFKDCKNLLDLRLERTPVTDAGLASFGDFTNVQHLELSHTQVSDTGFAHFKGCKLLMGVDLSATKVSDTSLAHFKDCRDLKILNLRETKISDAGLVHLKDCKNLIHLTLQKTNVTATAVEELAKSLPACRIEWDGGLIEPRK